MATLQLSSTPVFCKFYDPHNFFPPSESASFCANTSKFDDKLIRLSVRDADRDLGFGRVGFEPEWGVRRKITVEEQRFSSVYDESSYQAKLLSIDEEIFDPIGTRYRVALDSDPFGETGLSYFGNGSGVGEPSSSSGGGSVSKPELSEPLQANDAHALNSRRRFAISRITPGENWYWLDGYEKPVYCAVSLCGSLKNDLRYYISEFTHAAEVFELIEIDGKRAIAVVAP
ncbi:MAG: hypothetical protein U1F46_00670 [Marinagarivorans sp.]